MVFTSINLSKYRKVESLSAILIHGTMAFHSWHHGFLSMIIHERRIYFHDHGMILGMAHPLVMDGKPWPVNLYYQVARRKLTIGISITRNSILSYLCTILNTSPVTGIIFLLEPANCKYTRNSIRALQSNCFRNILTFCIHSSAHHIIL